MLESLNRKLRSLKNTQKMTKAMKMVAASKLRRAHQAQADAKRYAQELTLLTSRISACVPNVSHPLLMPRRPVNCVIILIITSDKGLCGAFNHNANRRVLAWIRENRHQHAHIDLWCCGKKGFQYFERRDLVKANYAHVTAAPRLADAIKIGNDLARAFQQGRCDAVYLSYNQFFNPLVQKTIFEQVLPIDSRLLTKEKIDYHTQYFFEPDFETVLNFLIPHFLYFKIYFALLENSAGEHGARMTAMDSATKNASELIDQYTLYRNRARQTAITTELTEIIGGAQVLR